jgi:hypothetical protein
MATYAVGRRAEVYGGWSTAAILAAQFAEQVRKKRIAVLLDQ